MMLKILSIIALLSSSHFMDAPEYSTQGSQPIIRFGIIADVQYCDCEPAGSRYYRSSLTKLRSTLDMLRNDSVAFLVNLGDLIDRDVKSYTPVLKLIDSSGLRTYHVAGNHDYSVDERFKRRLPLPLENKEGYYSFSISNFRFIALNGNEISTYSGSSRKTIANAEQMIAGIKASGGINANDWNGAIGPDQLRWLKTQLDDASSGNQKVIIFCHFPIYPENAHNLLNNNEIIDLLGNYHNVLAWFAGHNHSGNYGNFNYIHCVNLKGMVETESTGSHALVEIYHNKIWIKGSGRERSQILAY